VEDWIDSQGRVLRRRFAFGLTIERSPFEVNYTNYQMMRAGDALRRRRVPSGRARRARQRSRRPRATFEPVEVVLARSDGPAWPGAVATLAGGRQSVRGDTVRIEPARGPGGWGPPRRGDATSAGCPPQTCGPSNRRWTTLLAANSTGDTLAALVRWVAQDVRYQETPLTAIGGGTAARDRRAGVAGKAHLLAALAELAGIPARVVSGVDVRQEGLPAHSWVEVWLRGWLAPRDPRGQLFGFLGPNGAGKTTTLRMIAGILRPPRAASRSAAWTSSPNPMAAKAILGFIPDRPFVYDKLTGAEFLRFTAALYGQDGRARRAPDRRTARAVRAVRRGRTSSRSRTATACGRS
jgi:transglutaminase-like putative cysteine protease